MRIRWYLVRLLILPENRLDALYFRTDQVTKNSWFAMFTGALNTVDWQEGRRGRHKLAKICCLLSFFFPSTIAVLIYMVQRLSMIALCHCVYWVDLWFAIMVIYNLLSMIYIFSWPYYFTMICGPCELTCCLSSYIYKKRLADCIH